jgi:hypothetical protein
MDYLPHKCGEILSCQVSFTGPVDSLERCIRLESLRLAKTLARKLNALFALTSMGKQFAKLFLGLNRDVFSLHI